MSFLTDDDLIVTDATPKSRMSFLKKLVPDTTRMRESIGDYLADDTGNVADAILMTVKVIAGFIGFIIALFVIILPLFGWVSDLGAQLADPIRRLVTGYGRTSQKDQDLGQIAWVVTQLFYWGVIAALVLQATKFIKSWQKKAG